MSIELIKHIAPVIIWTLYSVLEGISDAFTFHVRHWIKSLPFDIHKLFVAQRSVVWLFVIIYSGWINAAACAFLFVPLHNGMYYWTRNYLDNDIYPEGFWDHNNRSDRLSTKYATPTVRLVFLVIGIWIFLTEFFTYL